MALFTCLLSATGHQVPYDVLLDRLWPTKPPAHANNNLRYTIHRLRAILGDRPVSPDGDRQRFTFVRRQETCLALRPGAMDSLPADRLDADAFADAARVALDGTDIAACRAALTCYTGDYLAGIYDDWVARRRDELRHLQLALLLHQATLAYAAEPSLAEHSLRAVLRLDPLHEAAAHMLMNLLAERGQRGEALRVYQVLKEALGRDLGIEPDPRLDALCARLLPSARPARRAVPLPARLVAARVSTCTVLALRLATGTRTSGRNTRAWHRVAETFAATVEMHGGVVAPSGTAHRAIFSVAAHAVSAAYAMSIALEAEYTSVYAMALHSGEVIDDGTGYAGPALDHGTLLCGMAHPGQVVASQETEALTRCGAPAEIAFRPLGAYWLTPDRGAEQVYQVAHPALPDGVPGCAGCAPIRATCPRRAPASLDGSPCCSSCRRS